MCHFPTRQSRTPMSADPRFQFYYPSADAGARYIAEMIALSPTPVADRFTVHENGANQVYYLAPGVANRFGADAIAAVADDLADAVAAYAAAHNPEWTFMYDPDCAEDRACVQAIRGLPPAVGISFAIIKAMPAQLGCCALYHRVGGQAYLEGGAIQRPETTRNALLSAMAARQAKLFPMRQHAAYDLEVVTGDDCCMRKRFEKDVVTLRNARGLKAALATAQWPAAVTTLWYGPSVWYGDAPVAAQLAKLVAALATLWPAPRVWYGESAEGTRASQTVAFPAGTMCVSTPGYNQEDTCCINAPDAATVAKDVLAAAASDAVRDAVPDADALRFSPEDFFEETRQMWMDLGDGGDGVRFRMYVRWAARESFLTRLGAVPPAWRARISVVYVADDTQLKADCVDLDEDAATAFWRLRGNDQARVLAMLAWKKQ